jgi:transketolase
VGFAATEAHLAARFNKPDAPTVIDNYTCALP